jgi:hypothetical protein
VGDGDREGEVGPDECSRLRGDAEDLVGAEGAALGVEAVVVANLNLMMGFGFRNLGSGEFRVRGRGSGCRSHRSWAPRPAPSAVDAE